MVDCHGLLYSNHALNAMIKRSIRSYEIEDVVIHGEILKYYSTDKPYPSYLLFKLDAHRPLHVVISKNPEMSDCIVITCHEPDTEIWTLDFKKKK